MSLTVAACQIASDVGEPQTTEGLVAAVRSACDQGARLVVLPELALAGYSFRSVDEARSAAESQNGRTVSLLRQLSAELDAVIVCGFPEASGGLVHNSAVIVDSGRLLGCYRKVHLWGTEPEYFTAHHAPPLVVDTQVGRIGVMICYDLEFPEWVRLAAQAGAEILAVPANWPLAERPAGQRAIEVAKAQAAAATYGVHVVVADRCGVERGTDWVGGSLISNKSGYLLAGPATREGERAAPTVLLADLDPRTAQDKRLGEHNDAMKDRRPDLYT